VSTIEEFLARLIVEKLCIQLPYHHWLNPGTNYRNNRIKFFTKAAEDILN
jgi:hypothetical protein